jgi:hypothetical protein
MEIGKNYNKYNPINGISSRLNKNNKGKINRNIIKI